jgi:hypothetical protein
VSHHHHSSHFDRRFNVAIFHKNFGAIKGLSHIGLGVSAFTNYLVLRQHNIETHVFAIRNSGELVEEIRKYEQEHLRKLTHVVIAAPWIHTTDLRYLANHYKHIQFVVISHSNVGFLQADPSGMRLLREGLELSKELSNFHVGGNCHRFVCWLQEAYGSSAVFLPNLYPVSGRTKFWNHRDTLKIGAFGAIRPLKNMLTSCAAAIIIANELEVPTEFHVNVGREEGGTGTILNSAKQMCANLPNFTLVEDPWSPWDKFKHIVGSMDLLMQVSYTESFNMVTADGISLGVPSVVSNAIDWAPKSWQAKCDDALDVAKVGLRLLLDNKLREEGMKSLQEHTEKGFHTWLRYLEGEIPNIGCGAPCDCDGWCCFFKRTWKQMKHNIDKAFGL